MIKQLKKFTINLIAGANVATVLVMLLTGYADRLHPVAHPLLSCLGMVFPIMLLVNLLFLFFWIVFHWRKMWIPIVGYVLVYVPITIYMPLHRSQEVPEGAIKLLSYNVCGYGGNYKYEEGFDTVFGYIRRVQPDIVCLQEDVDSWRRYVMQRWSKLYPYNDTIIFTNKSTSMNGVGIHTRFPILRRERIAYDSNANGSVAYFLDVDGDTLLVINNHLEGTHLSPDDRSRYKEMLRGKMKRDTVRAESKLLWDKLGQAAAKRAPQAEAVSRYIREHSQYPVIVCGDFNDSPLSYSRRTVSQGLTDCFVETGNGLGLSYNQKGFFFRIDHVMCSDDFVPYNCTIDNEMDASDHYPVVCWLKKRDIP